MHCICVGHLSHFIHIAPPISDVASPALGGTDLFGYHYTFVILNLQVWIYISLHKICFIYCQLYMCCGNCTEPGRLWYFLLWRHISLGVKYKTRKVIPGSTQLLAGYDILVLFCCKKKKSRIYFKHRVESLLANNLQPAWFFLNYKTCYLLCTIGWQPLWNAARSFSKGFKFDLLTLQELCKRMLERIKSCKDNQQHSSISLQHLAWSP